MGKLHAATLEQTEEVAIRQAEPVTYSPIGVQMPINVPSMART
jgi:hypothetical protein